MFFNFFLQFPNIGYYGTKQTTLEGLQ
jgi:hypothetical protein